MDKRLLVFRTSTMGECDLAMCAPDDVLSTISERMGYGAEGVEDITGDWDRAIAIVRHFNEYDLDVEDSVRAFIAARGEVV